jgi:hypothetical protein
MLLPLPELLTNAPLPPHLLPRRETGRQQLHELGVRRRRRAARLRLKRGA